MFYWLPGASTRNFFHALDLDSQHGEAACFNFEKRCTVRCNVARTRLKPGRVSLSCISVAANHSAAGLLQSSKAIARVCAMSRPVYEAEQTLLRTKIYLACGRVGSHLHLSSSNRAAAGRACKQGQDSLASLDVRRRLQTSLSGSTLFVSPSVNGC